MEVIMTYSLSKSDGEQNFVYKFNNQPSGLGATRANILRLLRSLDLVGWNTHEETGRVDRKAFTRFAVGSTAIFQKRVHVEAEKSAVSVLIDCSGSMNSDGRIQTAEAFAIQLARILDKANVEYNVTGFNGSDNTLRLNKTGANINETAVRYETPVFIPFKTWKDSLQKASAKLGSISKCAGGSTPDYSSLSIIIDELSQRDEHRKIVFLVTDAEGYTRSHMKYLQSLADKLGIKIIAIGIGNTELKSCFTNSEDVRKVDDLASSSFNKLLKELQ